MSSQRRTLGFAFFFLALLWLGGAVYTLGDRSEGWYSWLSGVLQISAGLAMAFAGARELRRASPHDQESG